MPLSAPHTDIKATSWIDHHLPASFRPYARLLRLDRPVGSWLLLLPCWWSLALASPQLPDPWLLTLFALGAVTMRGAGCIINDIYDRNLDAQVERTQTRPLASGEIAILNALLFLGFVLSLGSFILLQFNFYTKALAAASLALVFTYPLMKRITWWPQLFLGFTFNWGALVGWSALHGSLSLPAILLYVGGVFWTLGYDTIYAHQDKKDDARLGVKSLALRLGDQSKPALSCFYALALFFFGYAAFLMNEGAGFYAFFALAVLHAVWQLWGWNPNDPANCLKRFQSNRDFGLILFAAFIFGKFL